MQVLFYLRIIALKFFFAGLLFVLLISGCSGNHDIIFTITGAEAFHEGDHCHQVDSKTNVRNKQLAIISSA